MAYAVSFERVAFKALEELSKRERVRIIAKIEALGDEPRPSGSKKLVGEDDVWRIRIGDYRVIYRVKDAALVVLVIKIGHRREVYRSK